MLAIENLNVRYGAVDALKGISLHVAQGEVVTLIGGTRHCGPRARGLGQHFV